MVSNTEINGSQEGSARIAIDRGGTFTDAICSRPGREDIVIKVGLLHELEAITTDAALPRLQPD